MKANSKPQKGSLVFAPHAKTATVIQSAIDSLFCEKEGNPWPETVLANNGVAKEITTRKKLADLCGLLFETQNGDLFQVYQKGLIKEESLIEFYTLLGQELTKLEMQRIILYLPFEYLPEQTWQTSNQELNQAMQSFIKNYRMAWYRLADVWDFRRDFVDGDIPEAHEYPVDELNLVCKVAHLIPILVQKEILSIKEVCSIVEYSSDQVLKQSIRETFPTLYEMGLLNRDEVLKLEVDFSQPETPVIKLEEDFTTRENWLEELATRIEITKKETLNKLKNPRSSRWLTWKKDDETRKVLEHYGHELVKSLSTESGPSIKAKLLLDINNQDILLVIVFAIRELVETRHQTSFGQALKIKNFWKTILLTLHESGGQQIREVIESTWSRWSFLQLVPLCEKRKLPFFVQTGPQTFEMICETKQAKEAKVLCEKIQSNNELLEYLYPTVLMYGSLVKEYGSEVADLDLAVFVRPEIPIEKRGYIQKLLRETISSKYMKNPPVEFWLSKQEDRLVIRDFETIDASLGDSSLLHVLWKGIWFGDTSVVYKFHEELLPPYLEDPNKERLFRELERGLLQYRLMHKGYDRLYPKGLNFQTQYGHDLGIESRFWDSGYRKLATKIFLKNVFVPYLKK